MPSSPSPFLTPNASSNPDSLAILYLRRDHHLPIILQTHDSAHEGYAEGKVTNTRFGSFPHSTLIGVPWGTQVRASEVDTGSRGRKGHVGAGKKRKREEGGEWDGGQEKKPKVIDTEEDQVPHEVEREEKEGIKAAVAARTGFVHLLPPTPELWTASLPHRTQVVYTPDYSYILQQLRVRPGSVIIEAGAGSGSFTHAAARAVFNGYPATSASDAGTQTLDSDGGPQQQQQQQQKRNFGKVYSYEFHQSRWEKLKAEISEHGLDGIVEINQRDVCQDGFMLGDNNNGDVSPTANAIFLDLPAPWLALKHLTRRVRRKPPEGASQAPTTDPLNAQTSTTTTEPISPSAHLSNEALPPTTSPLNPRTAIHICTFSPCIEQVQRTVSVLRQHGWVSISMVELSHRRIEIQRQRVGLHEEGLRGVNPSPADVDEAVARLREVEGRSRHFHELERRRKEQDAAAEGFKAEKEETAPPPTKQQRLTAIRTQEKQRKTWQEGRLVHRAEPDLKTHTSYLVFAVLPRE
ncbi:MAG: hypothetical protein Q9191_007217, partial [Dirinaria sp. TL-2023a]